MLAQKNAVPAQVAANLQDALLMFREKLGQQQGDDSAARRMGTGISIITLGRAFQEVLVHVIRTPSFPIVLHFLNWVGNVLPHLLKQGFDFRQLARLEEW